MENGSTTREQMIEDLYTRSQLRGDKWLNHDGVILPASTPWMGKVLHEYGRTAVREMSDEQVAAAHHKWVVLIAPGEASSMD